MKQRTLPVPDRTMCYARRAGVLLVAALAFGAQADAGAPENTVVATVAGRTLGLRDLDALLQGVPGFQFDTLGATESAAKHHFIDDAFVRETLLAKGGEEKGFTAREPTLSLRKRVLANATLRAIRAAVPTAAQIPRDELQRYYDENRARYDSPERIALSRILVATQADADAVIAAFQKDATYRNWETLARDKSLDKATSMRGGNLGFIAADGSSNEAGVRADAALHRAASAVKDGELVPAAVKEGNQMAVVWRRGTRAGQKRSFEQAELEIRELVHRAAMERAAKDHIATLRKERVSPIDETAFVLAEPPPPDAVLREPRTNK